MTFYENVEVGPPTKTNQGAPNETVTPLNTNTPSLNFYMPDALLGAQPTVSKHFLYIKYFFYCEIQKLLHLSSNSLKLLSLGSEPGVTCV